MKSLLNITRSLIAREAPGLLFFDSGKGSSEGRCSYLMAYPTRWIEVRADGVFLEPSGEPLEDPAAWLWRNAGIRADPRDGFHTGWAGWLAFEFSWDLDSIHANPPTHPCPKIFAGEYAASLCLDHDTGTVTLRGDVNSSAGKSLRAVLDLKVDGVVAPILGAVRQVDPERYKEGVSFCRQAIRRGDVFEVNYTERFRREVKGDPFEFYVRMRELSTGEFFGFMSVAGHSIASVSPEQFLKVQHTRVVSRPIKGTRRRADSPKEDEALKRELLNSEKDRAENVMIVDLMRNDLTQLCTPGSVEVTGICELETYAGVHHLVSTVEGELAADVAPVDVLLSCFPAGSITGAPKLRSIELIAEVEASARGPYTGTMFLLDDGGYLDSNVLIRTAYIHEGDAEFGAGGAVVWDSDPMAEYEEALVKARAFYGATQ